MRHALLFASVLLTPLLHAATNGPRPIQQFTEDWRFSQSDAPETQSPTFNDASWQTVTLPHDWSIAGPVDPNNPSGPAGGFFPTGVAWYRKTFTIAPQPHHHTYIAFDGVMANSDVYINGALLGHHPYGYTSFHYDLTPHLLSGKNTIAVRVDNSQQPASRWYPGAGINRQVRLVTVNDIHIAPWGTFVTTPQVSAASATIHVRVSVTNESDTTTTVNILPQLTSPSGQHIVLKPDLHSQPATIAPHATADLEVETTIPNPDRWDLQHGSLYTLRAVLFSNNKPLDDESVTFGIREFHFDPDNGFFLNGVHHKIYGAALHTDAGALGTAVPLAAWQRRLEALRQLGVNAIRTAHNPPAPEFLDLCDRMGFLVMAEFFDSWTVGKNPYDYHLYFRDWSERDEAFTIQRDRNHPSIILWSVGNEIHDTPHPDIAIPILKQLVATAHANDPTRPVTQALFRPNVSHDYDNGLADLLDVIGQNYREQEILKAHADKPTRKIIGTENTHDRNQWVAMRDHPEYSGQFLWTGIDYLGEAGRWPSIGAGSGLLLTTSLPRARAFERQSWWTDPSTSPMVRIARRVQAARRSPTDPGYASPTSNNQQITANTPPDPTTRFGQPLLLDWTPKDQSPHTEHVEIYTNAEEVELLLNNKSLGTQKLHADASPITFEVPYAQGVITAIARSNGKVVAQDALHTAGAPAHLILSTGLAAARLTNTPTHDPIPQLRPDWNDVAYITATLVDANGTVLPDSETRIHFTASGAGKIIAVDNGNLLDRDPFQATDRKLYDGHAIAILRATAPKGSITITAATEGLPPAAITLYTARPSANNDIQRSF
jgi:beta-galactosidase